MIHGCGRQVVRTVALGVSLALLVLSSVAHASVAYGSINNFDAVNDTTVPCHGFEIEIDGIHSTDITYTYDWNHYGVPRITEDRTDPLNPKVFVRYESARNADGTWAAYTAVPAGPITPTDGHQFTDPSVNFGGEHFGVGFYGTPSAVRYNWLIDDGFGNLIHGGAVNIATPTFTYIPAADAAPAQVQAVIVPPPPPPAAPVLEFGEASWVKETRTSSHNNARVELRDLVSDDPDDPNDRNWQNGEPAEVEVEWQLSQTDFNSAGGGPNGQMAGAPQDLPNGDEIITRRYDFYKYAGPLDPETGEAMADRVGADGIHGEGVKTIDGVEVDLATVVVVGDYIGAQMAGFDAAGQIGLIDHLQDGETEVPYVDRTVVVGGSPPIVTTTSGALPAGMDFDPVTGILSGTPRVSGRFTFGVHATDAAGGDVAKEYILAVTDAGVVLPPHITITTAAAPAAGGSTSGAGEYVTGTEVTVEAMAGPGFEFTRWTDGGTEVSTSLRFPFLAEVNRTLVAVFTPRSYTLTYAAGAHGAISGPTPQTVAYAADGTEVTAVPEFGFHFVGWSDGSAANPRLDANVSADLTVTALFGQDPALPDGHFLALAARADVGAGKGWWDLTGTYPLVVLGNPLSMALVHGPQGRLTGQATCTLGKATVVNLCLRGSARGRNGTTKAMIGLRGAAADRTAAVSLTLDLSVDPANRQLVGTMSGTVRDGATTTPVSTAVALPISLPMDGTWSLDFQLVQDATGIAGTARLTLAHGVAHSYRVKGRAGSGDTVVLSPAGDRNAAEAYGIRITTTVTPLQGGWARLESFSGIGYGQKIGW
jgi:hypothetical protein